MHIQIIFIKLGFEFRGKYYFEIIGNFCAQNKGMRYLFHLIISQKKAHLKLTHVPACFLDSSEYILKFKISDLSYPKMQGQSFRLRSVLVNKAAKKDARSIQLSVKKKRQ